MTSQYMKLSIKFKALHLSLTKIESKDIDEQESLPNIRRFYRGKDRGKLLCFIDRNCFIT